MLILFDGTGQVGKELKNHESEFEKEILVHHKWDFLDKSESKQKDTYERFNEFVNKYATKEICFISTSSQDQNPYTFYKQNAERYLLDYCEKGYVIRLPNIIGRGICDHFREGSKKPFGVIELITLQGAVTKILKIIDNESRERINTVDEEKISAEMIYNLIQFGKHGLQ